jgi:P27 family predicted phage terminase small subunit
MTKGRKPIPTALKVLCGNPGKQKLPKNEPIPQSTDYIEPPPYLDEYALAEWQDVAPGLQSMGVLYSIDRQVLAAYCVSYSRFRKAEEAIHGLQEGEDDDVYLQRFSRMVNISSKAALEMVRYAAEFGLTASSRARLGVDWKQKKKSQFDGLLGKSVE